MSHNQAQISKDFRVLDNIFAIAARLTPKRDDPQARRAFLSDVFNSASSKARLGEMICKNITRIMDEPRKGPWFHVRIDEHAALMLTGFSSPINYLPS